MSANNHMMDEFEESMDKYPSFNSIQVVRCKHCYYNHGEISAPEWKKGDVVCTLHGGSGFKRNDFCSRGKRINSERNTL